MNSYKLKLTALTPIHIGTGEVYEPTNFVIDDGYLYEFDEVDFYKHLSSVQKEYFNKIVNSNDSNSLFQIHKIIKENKAQAIKVSHKKVQISKSLQIAYENKIGRAVQIEGGRRKPKTKVFNQFLIAKTSRATNTNRVYIPGSSLKGSISTALQELLYKEDRTKWGKLFEKSNPTNNIMKQLSISDTKFLKTYAMIGYALNKERFEDDELGPHTIVETIYSNEKINSTFETTINIDRRYQNEFSISMNHIKKAADTHYLPIFKQMFKPYAEFKGKSIDDFTNEYYSDAFYEKYKDFKLKENQFLLRVGKYSQARAVTIDGMRKIRVKISGGGPRRKPNRWETLDQETTTWMFGKKEKDVTNLLPFGWVLCEVVEQKDFL